MPDKEKQPEAQPEAEKPEPAPRRQRMSEPRTEPERTRAPRRSREGIAYVTAGKTGKTAHAIKTREPLEAVCGTRTIRNAEAPEFFDQLPEGFGFCWKCARGG